MNLFNFFIYSSLILVCVSTKCAGSYHKSVKQFFAQSNHDNNWAVLVCSSRYWFNYRHVANVLSIYRSVKRFGIPDSRIILMLADDMPCNSRNPKPGTVFNNAQQHTNVFGDDVEIDYKGYEVTVANFIRLLTGRVNKGTPKSKQLLTDDRSNILIYMTGHGGEGFLKFQDSEEITNVELADAFEQMWQKRRYNEILLITETCQAESMAQKLYSPNILGIGSSKIGEDSLSHHGDPTIGVYVIDRYTYYAIEFLDTVNTTNAKSLSSFLSVCPKRQCVSTVTVNQNLFQRNPDQVPLTDFFGSIPKLRMIDIGTEQDIITVPNQTNEQPSFTLYTQSKSQLNWHYIPQMEETS